MNPQAAHANSPVAEVARRARLASRKLLRLHLSTRNQILHSVADCYQRSVSSILGANKLDCDRAEEMAGAGRMSPAMLSRLRLNEQGVADMAARLREVASLADPLGRLLATTELDERLVLYKETCPLGVVAVVFESRPDVVPQVASLALKSGNAILLKGGVEAAYTNETLVGLWRETLQEFTEVPMDSIQQLHSRLDVMELLRLDRDVDLLVPRGGREFVKFIARNSRIPVLGHGEGICHIYVDRAADLNKALTITLDSKVQYPAACNAVETLLVHAEVAPEVLPLLVTKLQEQGVEIRGCPRTLATLPPGQIVPAGDEDWSMEYGDLILAVKIVDDLDAALEHIQQYGSTHTEAIVTEDEVAASRFLEEVDAAGVYHNASTRFGDGYRYGLGSEVGVSTSKLHARGPMGLEGLTTYKYKLKGDGHTVASYCRGERKFRHRSSQGTKD
ncbi:MAG TPA: glutamate-5-semialdehyde dehydrogenase [Candidatus Acidoferrum sp.]|nr:glutamate-5-semialdehyde dehydrogenase [Candidatus Acidoferrum sp.]